MVDDLVELLEEELEIAEEKMSLADMALQHIVSGGAPTLVSGFVGHSSYPDAPACSQFAPQCKLFFSHSTQANETDNPKASTQIKPNKYRPARMSVFDSDTRFKKMTVKLPPPIDCASLPIIAESKIPLVLEDDASLKKPIINLPKPNFFSLPFINPPIGCAALPIIAQTKVPLALDDDSIPKKPVINLPKPKEP